MRWPCRVGEGIATVADDIFGRCFDAADRQSQQRTDGSKGWEAVEHGKAHHASRMVVKGRHEATTRVISESLIRALSSVGRVPAEAGRLQRGVSLER